MRITRVRYVTHVGREVKYVEDFCWKFRCGQRALKIHRRKQEEKTSTKGGGLMSLWTRHTGGRCKPGDGY